MKLSSSDILSILRLFGIANAEHVPRDVSRSRFTHPSSTNILYDFRFDQKEYAVLVDDDAHDDTEYMRTQIESSMPGQESRPLLNPKSAISTYGLPYKGKDVYLFSIGEERTRLDIHLANLHSETSRSSWQKHIKSGYVTINGHVEKSPKKQLSNADVVEVNLPEAPDHSDIELDIVYIDDDIVVINKPAGILTHRKNEVDNEFTVADFFSRYMLDSTDKGRPGVVHRLDRDTSGLVVGARHQKALEHLKQQFADRQVEKVYVAVLNGIPKNNRANIDLPIVRSHTRPGSFIVSPSGKPAQTYYEVTSTNDSLAAVTLKPTTGRTHQLRVHMDHLGTPIAGDRLYGDDKYDRLYLHAHRLSFRLLNGEIARFESEIPREFSSLIPEIASGKTSAS